jgi:hypothetical protein
VAGLGKKTFTAGEVLTASDVNGYLMDQAVMVFGGTAARSSAIPSPSEGMMSYRTDDNVVEVFNGTAYVSVGGAALLKDADISATTGSPSGTAYSSGGTAYKAYSFTGTGSITLSKAGLVDVMILGGGGGSVSTTFSTHRSGGAGGGGLTSLNLYLASGSTTITVGAGGAVSSVGNPSKIGSILSMGGAEGGGRANSDTALLDYACGGGGGNNGGIGGTGFVGFNGANGAAGDNASGGGGGMGGSASGVTAGIGLANSLTGTAVTYGAGGAGQAGTGAGTAGSANTGNGASGPGGVNNGAAGGSGLVVIRVLQ